jgi:hypothetical protein
MMKPISAALAAAALAAPLAGLAHASAHEHGVVHLDVAVESRKITLQIETPLDNLIGFEHAPRNPAEQQRADAAVARLKAADKLVAIDPAAQCKLAAVELSSAALKLGTNSEPDAGGHADLDGRIEFDCQNAERAAFIDIGLFEAFVRIQRIEVQAIVPKGQLKLTLKRPARRIGLVR